MNEDVIFFWDGPFSQWYKSNFIYRGCNFCTAEQFMMYHKAIIMDDIITASMIIETGNPRRQKELGRKVKNFDQKLWNLVKRDIVYTGNYLKFSQNEDLKKILFETEDKLIVEASPYDEIWGIGMSEGEAKKTPPEHWKGENLLGKAIMEVRFDLRQQIKNEETRA